MSTELLTKLEKERFISLNDRTVCLTFSGDIPSANSLRQLGFPYQTLNFQHRSSSVFVIFGDLESKRKGIEILENGRVDGKRISLDFTRKCVPVTPEELEESRELDVLAVHGVPFKTRDKEILQKFPRAGKIHPNISILVSLLYYLSLFCFHQCSLGYSFNP